MTQLVPVVPHLAPEMLHHLIRHAGLDVCAELVAAATPAQLASVFDLDLWRSVRPGHDERFDAERFGEWVELLVDAGDAVAARTFAAMDEHLAVAGLSRYVRVFDPAAIATSLDGEPLDIDIDGRSHQGPECIVGGYLVRGRTADAWDAIVALLVALAADHPDRFHAVMRRCRRLSNSTPEVDGLDNLLMEPDQLLHDVAADREHRRARQGYSTPADARAFLLMARTRRRPSTGEPPANPLVAAYFRAASDAPDAGDAVPRRVAQPPATRAADHAAVDAVVHLLDQAGLVPHRPRGLLEAAHAQPSRLALLRTSIEYVRDRDDIICLARSQELAFLANTLAAGCSVQSRSFTPQESADAAAGICNLGLEHWPARWPDVHRKSGAERDGVLPDTFLIDHDLVSAFEVGWAILYEDVTMLVAGELVTALSELRCIDADIQEGLDALRKELRRQRRAGTPWRARHALEVLAMLDMPAWVSVLGLLDECPVMPAALTATLEGRTGGINAAEFEFISTRSQLARVREFMARFLEILGR